MTSPTEHRDAPRALIEAELREQKETLETINRVGQVLAAELDMQKVVQAVTDAATELTGAAFGSFFYNVLDAEGASYMLYTLSGVPREAFSHFPMPRATDLFGPTFRGEGVMRIPDVTKDPRYGKNSPYYGMPEGHLPVTSYLAVPVISRSGEVMGGLFFGHPDADMFTARHERLVVGLAAQAAVAVDNARLFEALRRSEGRVRRLIDSNIIGVVVATLRGGQITDANDHFLRLVGYTREELREGKVRWVEMTPPEFAHLDERALREVQETGSAKPYEKEYIRKDGTRMPILIGITLLEGSEEECVAFILDITERKQAEEELLRRSRQSALGAEVGVALAGTDTLGNILQRCAEAMVKHLDAAFARIWTLDASGQALELQASAGLYTHLDGAHGRVPVGQFKIGRIAATRTPHLTNSVVDDPQVSDREWARREGMVSFAGYPLLVGETLLGVMAMFAHRPLANDTLEALASVANTIAQGIERKHVEETLKRLNHEREQLLEEVSTPLVPVLEGVLVLPIIGSLDNVRMQRATSAALDEVTRTGARVCIIDITGARIIDERAVANLSNLVAALRLVGAEAYVTGVTVEAAQALVRLGLDLGGLRTHRTLAQALVTLINMRGQPHKHGRR